MKKLLPSTTLCGASHISSVSVRMKRFISTMLISIATFNFVVPAFAANEARIAELLKQIEVLEEQAKQFKGSIAEERAKAQTLQRDIAIIKKEIQGLEQQIILTSTKISKTKVEITDMEGNIFETQQTIDRRRETVGELLIFLNQRDNENLMATLMKNENLSTFLSEAQQLANVNDKLLELIGDLRNQKQQLEISKVGLEDKKGELISLNQEQSAKRSSLTGVKSQKDTILAQTKGQEAEYQKMLTAAEKKRSQLFLEMQQLESDAVAGGLFIIRVKATGVPPRGTKLFTYPEDSYRLTQGYGMTTYAKRGAYGGSPHNGIDIAGGYGTPIKVIGSGEIIANGFNSGFGNWVAVQHDSFGLVSVYGHMSAFAPLRVGTKVTQGQAVGYEGSTGNSTGSHVHLSLYQDFFTYTKAGQLYFNYFDGSLNPSDYL
ncbi:MAG: peptidoglycan DD-metalloendopeptidase family protein [Patescibacteria group bacterium]